LRSGLSEPLLGGQGVVDASVAGQVAFGALLFRSSILPHAATRLGGVIKARPSWLLAALTVVVGVAYVWVVSPGLPYDEPSHWSNVLFYAGHGSLPILGHPGVTYEAQMGPVAYVVDAVAVRSARAVGWSADIAFRLVRLLGVLELAGAVLVVAALTRRLLPNAWAALAAAAVFGLNPMLLTMSASVQNDTLALLLGLLALQMAIVLLDRQPTIGGAAMVGVVAGLAVLTKLTTWAVVVAIGVWLLWRHRRSGLTALAAFLASVFALTGWWFVRNGVLYGDPSASAGVARLGLSFPPYRIHGLGGIGHIIEEVVTYLWLPTEYVRNTIKAPTMLKGALLVITVAVILVGVHDFRRLRGPAPLVLGCGLLAFSSWLVLYLVAQAYAPRVAYLALPTWIALVGLSLARGYPRASVVGVVAGVVVLNVWTLNQLSRVNSTRYDLTPTARHVLSPPEGILTALNSCCASPRGTIHVKTGFRP
jgi:D-alanyl-D-alanine carboxypeptidase (penicillin-binding protein 5/6)